MSLSLKSIYCVFFIFSVFSLNAQNKDEPSTGQKPTTSKRRSTILRLKPVPLDSMGRADSISLDKFFKNQKGPVYRWKKPEEYLTIHTPDFIDTVTYMDSIEECYVGGFADFFGGTRDLGISLDKNFLLKGYFRQIDTEQDSAIINEGFLKMKHYLDPSGQVMPSTIPPRNSEHISHLKGDFARTIGKTWDGMSMDDYKNYVYYFPEEFAKSKFNADSVAIYDYWPKGEKVFEIYLQPSVDTTISYVGCRVYMVMKKEVGVAFIYCFYTEEGKPHIDETMQKLEGIVRFKDYPTVLAMSAYKAPAEYTTLHIPASFNFVADKDSEANFPMESPFACKMGSRYLACSQDKNFILLTTFQQSRTVQDSINMSIEYQRSVKPLLELGMEGKKLPDKMAARSLAHKAWVSGDILRNVGKKWYEDSEQDYNKYVHYYPEEFAKSKFKADSVAIYDFWPKEAKVFKVYDSFTLKPSNTYKANYIGSRAYMIYKSEVGYVIIYCFYTKEGKSRLGEVMKEIEGIVKFKS